MFRTTFYLTVLSFLNCLIFTQICNAALLVWENNAEDDLAGYHLYYGTSSDNYTSAVDVGNVTEYMLDDLNLQEDVIYYIALTAYDFWGNESYFSSELEYLADDGVPYNEDNCPDTYNPYQEDTYPPQGNGIGDACDCEGNLNCDLNVDAHDVRIFIEYFNKRLSIWGNPCTNLDPCYGDFNCDTNVDILDAIKLLEDFNKRLAISNPCPPCDPEVPWCSY